MDKPTERRTIKIKINGKDSPFAEKDKAVLEEQKTDSQREQLTTPQPLISETAAAKEPSDETDSFDWVLPQTTTTSVQEEFNETSDSSKKKPKMTNLSMKKTNFKVTKFPFKKMNLSIFFSIFFAVLLGTFFGLMLLKIVPAEKLGEDDQPVVNQEVEPPPADEKSSSSGTVTATRPAINVAIVQEGIYSTRESAGQIKDDLNNKGVPVEIFTSDGQFALFVGVSSDVEEAKSIGNGLKASGVDTYSKQWSIGDKNLSNLHEEEKKLLEVSPQIFQTFLEGVSSVNGANKIPKEFMDKVNAQNASLKQIDKEKLQNKKMIELHSQLEGAATQLKTYDQKPQASTLSKIQQHLLTFLANYQSL